MASPREVVRGDRLVVLGFTCSRHGLGYGNGLMNENANKSLAPYVAGAS